MATLFSGLRDGRVPAAGVDRPSALLRRDHQPPRPRRPQTRQGHLEARGWIFSNPDSYSIYHVFGTPDLGVLPQRERGQLSVRHRAQRSNPYSSGRRDPLHSEVSRVKGHPNMMSAMGVRGGEGVHKNQKR